MATDADTDPDVDPLAWARDHMPVLDALRDRDAGDAPFDGETVAVSSHLEATTGVFIETLAEAGAHVLGVLVGQLVVGSLGDGGPRRRACRRRFRISAIKHSARRVLAVWREQSLRCQYHLESPRLLGSRDSLRASLGRSLPYGSLRSPFGQDETLTPFASRAVRSLGPVLASSGFAEQPAPSSPAPAGG
jgi:hypothetical protein